MLSWPKSHLGMPRVRSNSWLHLRVPLLSLSSKIYLNVKQERSFIKKVQYSPATASPVIMGDKSPWTELQHRWHCQECVCSRIHQLLSVTISFLKSLFPRHLWHSSYCFFFEGGGTNNHYALYTFPLCSTGLRLRFKLPQVPQLPKGCLTPGVAASLRGDDRSSRADDKCQETK